jgi:hypothetical protein
LRSGREGKGKEGKGKVKGRLRCGRWSAVVGGTHTCRGSSSNSGGGASTWFAYLGDFFKRRTGGFEDVLETLAAQRGFVGDAAFEESSVWFGGDLAGYEDEASSFNGLGLDRGERGVSRVIEMDRIGGREGELGRVLARLTYGATAIRDLVVSIFVWLLYAIGGLDLTHAGLPLEWNSFECPTFCGIEGRRRCFGGGSRMGG